MARSPVHDFFKELATYELQPEINIMSVDDIFTEESSNVERKDCLETLGNMHFHPIDYMRMILILEDTSSLYFRGRLTVKCLTGSVDIHGFTLSENITEEFSVHSLYGQSALCFTSLGLPVDTNIFRKRLEELGVSCKDKDKLLNQLPPNAAVILLCKYSSGNIDKWSMEKKNLILPQRLSMDGHIYFSKAEEWFNCVFDIPSGNRIPDKMIYLSPLKSFANKFITQEGTRLLVCGGKGVGKSTTLQYIVNKVLGVHKAALYIDCDIGQPEFFVPGCVSVILLNKPLLGPNYTHNIKPIRSLYVGFTDSTKCLSQYLAAVKEQIKFCCEVDSYKKIPWLLNTLGYTRGYGPDILLEIILAYRPSNVVQIDSINHNLNFPFPYDAFNVNKMVQSDYNVFRNVEDHVLEVNFSFDLLYSSSFLRYKNSIANRTKRALMFLSYLTTCYHNLRVVEVPINKMYMNAQTCNVKEIMAFQSFPTSKQNHKFIEWRDIVFICVVTSNNQINFPDCIGYGVVLNQTENNTVNILTTVSSNEVTEEFYVLRCEFEYPPDLLYDLCLSPLTSEFPKQVIVLGKKSQFQKPSLCFSNTSVSTNV